MGPKSDTFEKHAKKTKVIQEMPHLGKKERELYVNKISTHAKNEVICSQQSRISIIEQVIQEGLKGGKRKKMQQFATILHLYSNVVLCWSLRP